MNKIAQTAATAFAKMMKKGGYVTSDGSIFDDSRDGKAFAQSHSSILEDKEITRFSENMGEEIVELSDEEKREKYTKSLLSKYSEAELLNFNVETLEDLYKAEQAVGANDNDNPGGSDDNEINLDNMNKEQLIKLLGEINPLVDTEKHTRAKTVNGDLKDLIEKANSLVGFTPEELKAMATIFAQRAEAANEEGVIVLSKDKIDTLDEDALKGVILYYRDGEAMPENITIVEE